MYHMHEKPLTGWQRFRKFAYSYTGIMTWVSFVLLIWIFLYKYMFVNIYAPLDFMPELGEIFFAVALSVIASTIVLVITIYMPERHKRQKIDAIVLPWLKQFVLLGNTIIRDIAGSSDVNRNEFDQHCNYDLRSAPQNSSLEFMTGLHFADWFEYFDCIYENEEIHYNRLLPYMEMLPLEVLEDLELILMPDYLRGATSTYKQYYGQSIAGVQYRYMTPLADCIWHDAKLMQGIVDKYQEHA